MKDKIIRGGLAALGLAGFVWCAIPLFWRVTSLGVAAAAALLLFAGLYPRLKKRRALFCTLWGLCGAGLVWALALTGCMVLGTGGAPPQNATAVVLGSQVVGTSPSADLWARIAAAEAYLKENPTARAVASGGQGSGEDISEARAIRDALVRRGIDSSRIFLEERSANTRENIAFSMEIIAQNGLEPSIAVVTDEYHQFRACQIAKKQGVRAYSVCAQTPWYILSACWARELLAISKLWVLG